MVRARKVSLNAAAKRQSAPPSFFEKNFVYTEYPQSPLKSAPPRDYSAKPFERDSFIVNKKHSLNLKLTKAIQNLSTREDAHEVKSPNTWRLFTQLDGDFIDDFTLATGEAFEENYFTRASKAYPVVKAAAEAHLEEEIDIIDRLDSFRPDSVDSPFSNFVNEKIDSFIASDRTGEAFGKWVGEMFQSEWDRVSFKERSSYYDSPTLAFQDCVEIVQDQVLGAFGQLSLLCEEMSQLHNEVARNPETQRPQEEQQIDRVDLNPTFAEDDFQLDEADIAIHINSMPEENQVKLVSSTEMLPANKPSSAFKKLRNKFKTRTVEDTLIEQPA